MSGRLTRFLIDLACDPDRARRSEYDDTALAGELDRSDLSADEKSAVMSRDAARIRLALQHDPGAHGRMPRSGSARRRTSRAACQQSGSLNVVGTGISLIGHLTLEALSCMKSADELFYLMNDAAAAAWIVGLNRNATTLADCLEEGKPRDRSYAEMVERMLAPVRLGMTVCAAFYGHPGVFVTPSHAAIRQARREGLVARMLPAVSSEDCLFADLGVDPGLDGCQSFDATDFVASRRRFDPQSGLILWQVGALGERSIRRDMTCRTERLQVLTQTLLERYEATHPAILYEAALFPVCGPRVTRVTMHQLDRQSVSATATLYVPPARRTIKDPKIIRWFQEP